MDGRKSGVHRRFGIEAIMELMRTNTFIRKPVRLDIHKSRHILEKGHGSGYLLRPPDAEN